MKNIRNLVAKNNFNRPKIEDDKTKYKRKDKHATTRLYRITDRYADQ